MTYAYELVQYFHYTCIYKLDYVLLLIGISTVRLVIGIFIQYNSLIKVVNLCVLDIACSDRLK